MRGLLTAELRRLLARRVTWVAALVLLGVTALSVVPFAVVLAPPTAAEQVERQRDLETSQREWDTNHAAEEQACRESGGDAEECTYPRPTAEDFGLVPPSFDETALSVVFDVALIAMFGALVVAASSIGAEFSSGSLGNWLTFVPRRIPVFVSKLVPVTVVAALGGALLLGLVAGALGVVTVAYGGTLAGVPAVLAAIGRGAALTGLSAVVGFCLALVARHTVAALGVLLGYAVLALMALTAVESLPALAWLPPWLPHYNLFAVLQNGTEYNVAVRQVTSSGVERDYVTRKISLAQGAVYWAVLTVATVIGSAALFRRRDVT